MNVLHSSWNRQTDFSFAKNFMDSLEAILLKLRSFLYVEAKSRVYCSIVCFQVCYKWF